MATGQDLALVLRKPQVEGVTQHALDRVLAPEVLAVASVPALDSRPEAGLIQPGGDLLVGAPPAGVHLKCLADNVGLLGHGLGHAIVALHVTEGEVAIPQALLRALLAPLGYLSPEVDAVPLVHGLQDALHNYCNWGVGVQGLAHGDDTHAGSLKECLVGDGILAPAAEP